MRLMSLLLLVGLTAAAGCQAAGRGSPDPSLGRSAPARHLVAQHPHSIAIPQQRPAVVSATAPRQVDVGQVPPGRDQAGPIPPNQVEPVRFHQPAQQSPANNSAGEPPANEPPAGEPLPPAPERPAANSELTLATLEGIALQNSPVLAEAAARIEAARGEWVQAGLPPNPVVGYSGQQLGSGGQAEQQGVFLGQELVRGQKLKLDQQVLCWRIQRLQNEWNALRLRTLTDVRIGTFDVLIAQRRSEVAGELVRITHRGVQAAQALFQGEEVSEADPLRARVEADSASILLQNAANQHVEAWRRLAAVIGMPDMPLQRIEGELTPENLQLTWDEELRRVLTESPEIAAAMADVEAARWAVQRAQAEVIPNVDVQAVIQDDRGTGGTNGNLQVTLPIPLWNRNQGGIRKARADAAAATRAVDRIALDLQTRLATAFRRYENARNQVEQYSREAGILANSRRTLELIGAGYRAEEFGLVDLLTAQRTYFQTNLAYLDSLRQLSSSVMEIRGLMLSGSLRGP